MNTNKRIFSSATLHLCRGAIIATIYVALTIISSFLGLSNGAVQFRISEIMCILPVFLPEAIPGLFIGCFISNFLCGAVIWDTVFGSIATLIGALGTYFLRKLPHRFMWLATLPAILSNAIIVPLILIYAYGITDGYFLIVGSVGLGEFVCAGILGSIFYYSLCRINFIKIINKKS